jgi:hypothetical protein
MILGDRSHSVHGGEINGAKLMSFLERVLHCNRRDMRRFVPFTVASTQLGWMTPQRAEAVLAYREVFQPQAGGVTLHPGLTNAATRSRAIAALVPELVATGLFLKPRNELYAVKNDWNDAPAFRIDRALVPGFGLRAYGVHINGAVFKRNGPHLWIGTRAADMKVEPGKLDNMVAGGQPAGLGLMENVVKECAEEAHISAKLARTARPAGVITYSFECPEGLRADTLFCYDLPMPAKLKPRTSDEITRYELMPLAKVLKTIRTTRRFKFNVNLVILDFAIRHGVVTPENEPNFEKIVAGLHERPQPVG